LPSRVALRRVAALGALLALGLTAAGGWGKALSGGLAGPVAGPVAGPLALHLPGRLASGAAACLPAVIEACRKEAAAFSKSAADGRAGRTKNLWRWAFPPKGLGVAGGSRHTWPNGAVLESWTPFGADVPYPLRKW
jgi:hypothetical protein